MSSRYRAVSPHRRVEILHDGTWWPGWLHGWVWFHDGWRGYTEWTGARALRYMQAVRADLLSTCERRSARRRTPGEP